MTFNPIESNTFEKEQINVGQANENDADGILDVQKERILSETKDIEGLSKKGFLIYPISKSDIIDAVSNPKDSFIFVAKDKAGVVIGYFLAYDFLHYLEKYPDWKSDVGNFSSNFEESETVYGKHVATRKGVSGVGTAIDKYSFNQLRERGYKHFIAEICEGPIENSRSSNFHSSKFDLNRIGGYKDKNKYDWGIYLKQL